MTHRDRARRRIRSNDAIRVTVRLRLGGSGSVSVPDASQGRGVRRGHVGEVPVHGDAVCAVEVRRAGDGAPDARRRGVAREPFRFWLTTYA